MFLFAICVHICFRPSENFESTFEISKKVRQNFIKKHLAFPSFLLHLYENQGILVQNFQNFQNSSSLEILRF